MEKHEPTTLEQYIDTDFYADREDIRSIEDALERTARTFAFVFSSSKGWPYLLNTGTLDTEYAEKLSQGTLGMSLVALGRVLDRCLLTTGTKPQLPIVREAKLRQNWDAALRLLVDSIAAAPAKKHRTTGKGASDARIVSGTFGDNNPITVSHLTELCSALDKQTYHTEKAALSAAISTAIPHLEELAKLDPAGSDPLLSLGNAAGEYQPNAFVPLRLVRAAEDLGRDDLKTSRYRAFFESTLHEQLSFSAIPDSRFDPSELLFCLEGLALCSPQSVDSSLFRRVLQVLADKQNTSAHWRPSKPFAASATGKIILPLSVEGANSLMRSVALIDHGRTYNTFTSMSLPLLRRFWNWLRARGVQFTHSNTKCLGWHSEHVNRPQLVHLWDTSQVVEFMLSYRELVQRHIGQQTLRLSRVAIREPIGLARALKWTGEGEPNWKDVVAAREPASSMGADYAVYEAVGRHFVTEPEDAERHSRSMLLFGPPGTGKTSLAEFLADALNQRLLTITVSDFLGSGGPMVEARAKAIFQMLEAQSNCVVLFDEIDAFLLDRDSPHYREQETLFQFMTPGMLTKFNDLRNRGSLTFIIATNYENRIDPAIKRPGRIDQQYLLLPPDKERREAIIKGLTGTEATSSDLGNSLFLGFAEIKKAVGATVGGENLSGALDRVVPSTGGRQYGQRIFIESQFPEREAACLFWLAKQVGKETDFENDFRSAAVKAAGQMATADRDNTINRVWKAVVAKASELPQIIGPA